MEVRFIDTSKSGGFLTHSKVLVVKSIKESQYALERYREQLDQLIDFSGGES